MSIYMPERNFHMGLAASQAKLLSITSRISQNELRAQQITRAKQALAQETADISEKYVNSLNEQQLTYAIYDENGEKANVELTGAVLSQYAPLRNQYALVNANGQVLVSELDGSNYENSTNLNEFLDKYGIVQIPTGKFKTVDNPDYPEAFNKWNGEYQKWISLKPDSEDEKYWTKETVLQENTELYDALYTTMNGFNCWDKLIASEFGVYEIEHVMTKMLDYDKDYVAYPGTPREATYHKLGKNERINSSGIVPATNAPYGGGAISSEGEIWADDKEAAMVGIRSKIKNNEHDPDLWQDIVNLYYENLKHLDFVSSDEIMRYTQATDNGQPAITVFELWDRFWAIIDRFKYMEEVEKDVFDKDTYNEDYNAWMEQEPDPLDVPPTLEEEIYEYSDKDQAQWYVNLWHRMNGESQDKDGYTTYQSSTTNTLSGKYTNQKRWEVLEDGLMNSAKWLKYALETCAVSIERVEFADPNEKGTGIKKTKWNSIIYTNAADIGTQQNQKLAAQSEAEFERKQKALTAKDEQYDSILKLLETEHNTLSQEYETAKAVVTKNTERTLKIYS